MSTDEALKAIKDIIIESERETGVMIQTVEAVWHRPYVKDSPQLISMRSEVKT